MPARPSLTCSLCSSRTDRTITLYGYLRGTNLPASGARVHIPGAGDLTVSSIEKLKDPCPLPTIEGEKRRKMGEKGKLIHAPMSDVGGVMFDKDAVYVNVMGSFTRRKEGEELEEGRQNGQSANFCTVAGACHGRLIEICRSSLQSSKARESAW